MQNARKIVTFRHFSGKTVKKRKKTSNRGFIGSIGFYLALLTGNGPEKGAKMTLFAVFGKVQEVRFLVFLGVSFGKMSKIARIA